MSSFLTNCDNCGTMIAKNMTCPNCQHAGDQTVEQQAQSSGLVEEFALRQITYNKNCTRSMIMRMIAGFIALVISVLTFGFLYRGNLMCLIGMFVLGGLGAVYGWMLVRVERLYPLTLRCPGCAERLDHLGVSMEQCPCCNVVLIDSSVSLSNASSQPALVRAEQYA